MNCWDSRRAIGMTRSRSSSSSIDAPVASAGMGGRTAPRRVVSDSELLGLRDEVDDELEELDDEREEELLLLLLDPLLETLDDLLDEGLPLSLTRTPAPSGPMSSLPAPWGCSRSPSSRCSPPDPPLSDLRRR